MTKTPDMKWFTDATFGMFIHWGLYAVPAGKWGELETPGISEWLMRKFEIPLEEYAKFANEFNPEKFDAEEWVNIAKSAGMKYMVITSKHHDGFSMYQSECDNYNIADATPFKRDPLKELADACAKAGIKFGFYYSQDQDWAHPGGSKNDWDFTEKTDENFAEYLENKVKPQLRELLTGYGPISIIWFDTPVTISEDQSRMLKDFVHELQPECLVSGRVGHGLGDYGSLGDNEIPKNTLEGVWEGIATMNNSWGFKASDNDWKSVGTLLRDLVSTIACGANYMLNVGPDAAGLMPGKCAETLAQMGDWLKINGEAIYGAKAFDMLNHHRHFHHGKLTVNKNTLYIIFFDCPISNLALFGVRNKIKKVRVLGNPDLEIKFAEKHLSDPDFHKYEFALPDLNVDLPVVVAVDLDGELDHNRLAYCAAERP